MTKKRAARTAVKRPSRRGAPPVATAGASLKKISNEIAVRFETGKERQLRSILSAFGQLESYAQQRMAVLRLAPGIDPKTVSAALDGLRSRGLVEFTTPVFEDRASKTRQVLTDEIVLRLKPGTSPRVLAALKAAHGIEIGRRNEFEPSQYIVKVPNSSGTQTLDVARSLDQCDEVEFASPNFLTHIKR